MRSVRFEVARFDSPEGTKACSPGREPVLYTQVIMMPENRFRRACPGRSAQLTGYHFPKHSPSHEALFAGRRPAKRASCEGGNGGYRFCSQSVVIPTGASPTEIMKEHLCVNDSAASAGRSGAAPPACSSQDTLTGSRCVSFGDWISSSLASLSIRSIYSSSDSGRESRDGHHWLAFFLSQPPF